MNEVADVFECTYVYLCSAKTDCWNRTCLSTRYVGKQWQTVQFSDFGCKSLTAHIHMYMYLL